jgi:predicted transcriptional regulator
MPSEISPASYSGIEEANREFMRRQEEASKEAIKIKALSNEFRRLILGLLYTDGPMYQSDILKHVDIRSNLLAYHLDILTTANMVEREYSERRGQNFSLYSIKEGGEKFLELIGAKSRLDAIKKENKKQAQQPRNVYESSSTLQEDDHFKKASKRKFDTSRSETEVIWLEDAEAIVLKKYGNLETALNQVTQKLNLEFSRDVHLSIPKTVSVLISREYLPEKAKDYFGTIMRVRNKVAHGEPIMESEAGEFTLAIAWFEFHLENVNTSSK